MVEKLIIASLQEFFELECINATKDETKRKLVFPIKRDVKRRVSEQEMRFLFVDHVEQSGEFHYSIEAPTTKMYKFSGVTPRSGNIDVCLYKDGKPKHLIEFKALNPGQKSYTKDFEKLICDEENLVNYFVQVIENTDKGIIPNIVGKYKVAIENVKEKYKTHLSCLNIFLCDMGMKEIRRYEVARNGELSEGVIIKGLNKK